MHREVTHNRFHPNFGHFVDAVFDFFRRRMPQEWTKWRDTVTDKFTMGIIYGSGQKLLTPLATIVQSCLLSRRYGHDKESSRQIPP